MEHVIPQLINYITGLDWSYIVTFILIAYIINHFQTRKRLLQVIKLKAQTRYRTAITGIIYGAILYFIRGYDIQKIECLINSFVFALVFHKLLLDGIIKHLVGKEYTSAEDLLNKNNSNGQLKL